MIGNASLYGVACASLARSKNWKMMSRCHASTPTAQMTSRFFVATRSVEQRAGRIYVDYNQNLAARNTIAPYSMRGRERPAVATPVTWEELGSVRGPDDLRFSPEDVLARVSDHGDLAADLLTADAPALPDTA